MSSGSSSASSRTRKQRLLRFGVDKSTSFWGQLFNWDRIRILLYYILFVGLIAVINESWRPAFFYQVYYTPPLSIHSRVDFSAIDEESVEKSRLQARQQALRVYRQDNSPIETMFDQLHQDLQTIHNAKDYNSISQSVWARFVPQKNENAKKVENKSNKKQAPEQSQNNRLKNCFDILQKLFNNDETLSKFDEKLNQALQPYVDEGILRSIENDSQLTTIQVDEIKIISSNNLEEEPRKVSMNHVHFQDMNVLKPEIEKAFGPNELSNMICHWLNLYMPSTLELDIDLTKQEEDQAADKIQIIENVFRKYSRLAEAGKPINSNTWNILKIEYKTWESQQTLLERVQRFIATWIVLSLFFIPSLYFASQKSQRIFSGKFKTALLCLLTFLVVAAAKQLSALGCNGQTMVLFIYAMFLGIAFGRRTAYLLSTCLMIVIILGSGGGFIELLYMGGVVGIAILPLNNKFYDRKRLIYISFITALMAFILAIVCNVLNSQPLDLDLLKFAGISALWIIGGGFLIQGLVPFEEWFFGIITDFQLLELSNPTHPLMQELIQRAPSTYNHSTFVAAISEAAARSIGAWGLMCRVGALYHDIGKFVTPEYFVENQKSLSDSQHTNLTPSMSALVIINHVKNGVVLAKKWGLPQQVIDMIEQHHGTTLVKYFYNKALDEQKKKLEESNPECSSTSLARLLTEDVDESMFRYPGPKPQSKESAILMLADCVESACRTLVEPTPKRVEDLVRSITADKLQDGQFDETQLTFNELKTIQDAIVLAIMSIYHARIKYPSQE